MRSKPMALTLLMLACTTGDDGATSTDGAGPTTGVSSSTTAAVSTETTLQTTSTVSTSSTTGESTTSADGAPFIISFSTNVSQITEGESVIFTAIVSDPDGLDDIAGGSLFTEDGAFSYGPFVAAGQEGTYSITVSWGQIDQVATIAFEDLQIERVFRVEFFDKEGHVAAKNTSITLHCDGGGACDGSCKDFQSDGVNCGGCGKTCSSGCADAMCLPALGECIDSESGFSTCDAYCQTNGGKCVEAGCDGATIVGFNGTVLCMTDEGPKPQSEACNFPQTWDSGRIAVRCCCSDTN